MHRILKKYAVCLVFSIDLFILVWLSEILRNIILALSTGLTSGIFALAIYSVEIFFLFVFGIVPLILLAMWLINPIAIKKLFEQFGLTEKSLDKREKEDTDKDKTEKPNGVTKSTKKNSGRRKKLSRHDLFIALVGGLLVGLIALVPSLWQTAIMNSTLEQQKQEIDVLRQQVDIMNQSLLRRPQLVMTIPTDTFVMTHYNGSIQITNTTMHLSRDQKHTFTLYLSNVGDGFAYILYYAVNVVTDTNYTSSLFYKIPNTILKPSESTTIDWTFEPSGRFLDTQNLTFTFVVGSVDTTLSQTIKASY